MTAIEITGITASALTSIQVVCFYSGQLFKLMRCSPVEARGVHVGFHICGTASHLLWFVAGVGLESVIIAVPNGIGGVLACLIAARLLVLRRSDEKSSAVAIA